VLSSFLLASIGKAMINLLEWPSWTIVDVQEGEHRGVKTYMKNRQ
jgi:hypothetical protein